VAQLRDLDPRLASLGAGVVLGGKTVIASGFGTYHQDGQLDDQNVPEAMNASFSLAKTYHPGLTYPIDPCLADSNGVVTFCVRPV